MTSDALRERKKQKAESRKQKAKSKNKKVISLRLEQILDYGSIKKVEQSEIPNNFLKKGLYGWMMIESDTSLMVRNNFKVYGKSEKGEVKCEKEKKKDSVISN